MGRRAREGNTDTVTITGGKSSEDWHSQKLRTRFASEAIDLAEVFKLLVGSTPLSGPVRFHVELAAPDGPSTGGGVQSVQHIRLVPEDGGAVLVAGWADQNALACELRTLDYLEAQHRQRFERSTLKAPPSPAERIDRKHYEQLVERLRAFFGERDISVNILDRVEQPTVVKASADKPAPRPAPPAEKAKGGSGGVLFLLGVLVGALFTAAGFLLARR